mmetsp:Transcript_4928/g.12345  ORF Transcript_4928/g.12345 Transcript_4928/m.12345 type:complete len:246 (+) Transcript_4928:415-1152(+)
MLVQCRNSERSLPLRVGLSRAGSRLEQILHKLLAPIAGRVVEPGIPVRVHGEGVRAVVEEQLHHRDTVGADGVAERRNALLVLSVQGLLLRKVIVDGLQVAVLGGLVHVQRRLFDLFQGRLQLLGQPAHLFADFQHELLVLAILDHRLHPVLLYVLEDGGQLGVMLQRLHALLHGRVPALQLGVVVFRNGLRLKPASHRVGVLRELLEVFRHVGVSREVLAHLLPSRVVDPGNSCEFHNAAIAEF